jgi:hypothetical protein
MTWLTPFDASTSAMTIRASLIHDRRRGRTVEGSRNAAGTGQALVARSSDETQPSSVGTSAIAEMPTMA